LLPLDCAAVAAQRMRADWGSRCRSWGRYAAQRERAPSPQRTGVTAAGLMSSRQQQRPLFQLGPTLVARELAPDRLRSSRRAADACRLGIAVPVLGPLRGPAGASSLATDDRCHCRGAYVLQAATAAPVPAWPSTCGEGACSRSTAQQAPCSGCVPTGDRGVGLGAAARPSGSELPRHRGSVSLPRGLCHPGSNSGPCSSLAEHLWRGSLLPFGCAAVAVQRMRADWGSRCRSWGRCTAQRERAPSPRMTGVTAAGLMSSRQQQRPLFQLGRALVARELAPARLRSRRRAPVGAGWGSRCRSWGRYAAQRERAPSPQRTGVVAAAGVMSSRQQQRTLFQLGPTLVARELAPVRLRSSRRAADA